MRVDDDRGAAISVRCLFFATYRDAAGADAIVLDVPRGATVGDLVRRVRERIGSDVIPERPVVALNQEYATADVRLDEGDEVAFIPPVAGG